MLDYVKHGESQAKIEIELSVPAGAGALHVFQIAFRGYVLTLSRFSCDETRKVVVRYEINKRGAGGHSGDPRNAFFINDGKVKKEDVSLDR